MANGIKRYVYLLDTVAKNVPVWMLLSYKGVRYYSQ